jgi:hypothetical protein
MLYYFDLIPKGNKKIDTKNKLSHDGGFKRNLKQKENL